MSAGAGEIRAQARGTVTRPTPTERQRGEWIECTVCQGEEGESITTGTWRECPQCEGSGGYVNG